MNTTQQPVSRFKAVAVLWLLAGAAFGLFCAAYWPIHLHQRWSAPANFLERATYLHAQGRVEEAVAGLALGIHRHRPPFAEPYQKLHRWLEERGLPEEAADTAPFARFYKALEAPPPKRMAVMRSAVSLCLERFPMPVSAAAAAPYARIAAVGLARGFGLDAEETVAAWPVREQLALCLLAGDAFSRNGVIGDTGVRSPVNILAVSEGCPDRVPRAHILLRGEDYASGRRGFDVALVNAESGQVFQLGHFDVYESESEAVRMAGFLRGAPAGCIGVFTVLDDASASMTPALIDELRRFGLAREANIERRSAIVGLRYSFAGIGVKGAREGAALQAWSPDAFRGHEGHPVACGVIGVETARGGAP